ncbi:Hpt domain-containing protein [Pseudolysobacter antarcticus]|uniref:Hpt domain-containing protein n=1 Tax=Pseudolysobacter antarcticus TaxID=2511995 RepID=UPI003CCCCEE5
MQPNHPESDFAALAHVVGNDDARLQRLLSIFATSARADLGRWTQARHAGDCDILQRLAHRLKSGCQQLGEQTAASAFDAVEQHRGTAAELESLAESAQLELEQTLDRVTAFQTRGLADRT